MTHTPRLAVLAAISTAVTAAALTLTAIPAHADGADVTCQTGHLNGTVLTAAQCQNQAGVNIVNVLLTATFAVEIPSDLGSTELQCSAGSVVAGQMVATGCG